MGRSQVATCSICKQLKDALRVALGPARMPVKVWCAAKHFLEHIDRPELGQVCACIALDEALTYSHTYYFMDFQGIVFGLDCLLEKLVEGSFDATLATRPDHADPGVLAKSASLEGCAPSPAIHRQGIGHSCQGAYSGPFSSLPKSPFKTKQSLFGCAWLLKCSAKSVCWAELLPAACCHGMLCGI